MIKIDGSWGEGGGQILRTSLTLATLTGQALRLHRIRAARPRPGLAAQHLTAARAAATLCQAQVRGDVLGSTTLEFIPTAPPQAGEYQFDVNQARTGGSAGAVTLILQTILLPLALAAGDSIVTLKGGTHVAWSPSVTYIEQVYLPLLRQIGIEAEVKLNAWGWYPRGGGEVELRVKGGASFKSLQLLERGHCRQVRGLAVVTKLPVHIAQRMVERAEKLCQQAGLKAHVRAYCGSGPASGAGIFLTAEYEYSRAGFSALGKRGLPAEEVAERATKEMLTFHATQAPVEQFLADQLLLPLTLAPTMSQYRVAEITKHLITNAWVIEQFGWSEIDIDAAHQIVKVIPTQESN
jgi:RNA 3'-terminal phosphate cyclase (ATP)